MREDFIGILGIKYRMIEDGTLDSDHLWRAALKEKVKNKK